MSSPLVFSFMISGLLAAAAAGAQTTSGLYVQASFNYNQYRYKPVGEALFSKTNADVSAGLAFEYVQPVLKNMQLIPQAGYAFITPAHGITNNVIMGKTFTYINSWYFHQLYAGLLAQYNINSLVSIHAGTQYQHLVFSDRLTREYTQDNLTHIQHDYNAVITPNKQTGKYNRPLVSIPVGLSFHLLLRNQRYLKLGMDVNIPLSHQADLTFRQYSFSEPRKIIADYRTQLSTYTIRATIAWQLLPVRQKIRYQKGSRYTCPAV